MVAKHSNLTFYDDRARSAINVFKARFTDPEIEKQYHESEVSQTIWLYRWAIGATVPIHTVHLLFDYILLEEHVLIAWSIRSILIIASAVAAWLTTKKDWFVVHVIAVTVTLWAINTVFMAFGVIYFGPDTALYFTTQSIFVMMYIYILLYSYFWLDVFLAIILVSSMSIALYIPDVQVYRLTTGIDLLFFSMFILTIGGYRASMTSRTSFFVSAQLSAQESTREERQRIMRDLHDDVAARILSLKQQIKQPEHQIQAREALNALRQTIYALDDTQPITLNDFMFELQSTIRERIRGYDIALDWKEYEKWPNRTLSAREHINLMRATIEGVINALKHGQSTHLGISLQIHDSQLVINITNHSHPIQVEDWKSGKGIINIRTRMQEIDGQAGWSILSVDTTELTTCELELLLPLNY